MNLLSRKPSEALKLFVDSRRAWFSEGVKSGMDSLLMCKAHSAAIDEILGSLFSAIAGEGSSRSALLALGGYGRREMGLYSDIDILFLRDDATDEHMQEVTDRILYPFWNCGVDIGGATRTIDDCRSIIADDAKALTGMLDARFLGGDRRIYDSLLKLLAAHLSDRKNLCSFLKKKFAEHAERNRKFGDTIYQLQPNIKEGEGGLRDFHMLLWIARAAKQDFDPWKTTRNEIGEDVRFIWLLRHALHLIEDKRVDRLSEAVQQGVARMLGYEDGERMSAAEEMMSLFYMHAARLHQNCGRAVERMRRQVFPRSWLAKTLAKRRIGADLQKTEHGTLTILPDRFKASPVAVLRLFAETKRRGLCLDVEAKDAILRSGLALRHNAWEDPEEKRIWKEIFSSYPGLSKTLFALEEVGLLEFWFPEMAPMFHRVQHDGFHRFTAGVHSVRAIGEIEDLCGKAGMSAFPAVARELKKISRPHVLLFATFLHDVGKGRGGDHTAIGADIAAKIANRMGLSSVDMNDISFLVRSHLLMSMLGFRRDVRDSNLVEKFAQTIRSPEILVMLYILTFADLRSVGPGTWTDWKGGLLAELNQRTQSWLMDGGASAEQYKKGSQKIVEAVLKHTGRLSNRAEVKDFIESLPERYLFSTIPETIAAHFMMSAGLKDSAVATAQRLVPERGCTEFSVVTRDSPGLFAVIAGVLTANGANVIDAQLYTSDNGIAIDIFWLADAVGRPLTDEATLARIRDEMKAVITGAEKIDNIVGGRFKRHLLSMAERPDLPRVSIDNDVSALETVVEVEATDRRGLLYAMASAFHEMGCTIDKARITTHVDRALDVFYIRGGDGKKVVSREKLEQIKKGLLEAIEE